MNVIDLDHDIFRSNRGVGDLASDTPHGAVTKKATEHISLDNQDTALAKKYLRSQNRTRDLSITK
jgi:hypothetical protein